MVRDYAAAMPPGYVFSIKVNSITLTHHYRSNKNASLVPNPYLLPIVLMEGSSGRSSRWPAISAR